MKNNCLNTAILLFTQTPHNVVSTKNLVPNIPCNDSTLLLKILGQHLQQTAEATGLPVFSVNSTILQKENFGNNLFYAFNRLFSMDYDHVIVLCNDYLQISTDTLLAAQNLLKTKDWVVGPTCDGGSYLFGCSRWAYPQTDVLELRWGTPHLFDDMVMSAALSDLKIGFLPTEIAMEKPSDFQLCLREYPPFESLSAQIENTVNAFESSCLPYGLPEIIDQRIFYKPFCTLPTEDGEEAFQFCLN